VPLKDNLLCGREVTGIHNGLKGGIVPNPQFGWVADPLHLELKGNSIVDIVANIFLIGEHLSDHSPGPRAPTFGLKAMAGKLFGDLAFRPPLMHEESIDPANHGALLWGPRDQHDPVGLKALLLTRL